MNLFFHKGALVCPSQKEKKTVGDNINFDRTNAGC